MFFLFLNQNIYVVGTQKNHSQNMFKLMDIFFPLFYAHIFFQNGLVKLCKQVRGFIFSFCQFLGHMCPFAQVFIVCLLFFVF